MISCFPENLVPLVNSSVGVSRVLVTGISFDKGRGVAHSPQNRWVSGLSVLHLGHFIPSVPLYYSAKE